MGQRAVSNGRLYVASMVDPKFLLLPILQQHKARFSPIEQVSPSESWADRRLAMGLFVFRHTGIRDNLGYDLGVCFRFSLESLVAC